METTNDFKAIRLEDRDGIRILTIHRPEALNALNQVVLSELDTAITDMHKDGSIKGLIITGHGEKSFVAGADISEFNEIRNKFAHLFAEKGQRLMTKIETLPFCTIAAVNGFALGGGLELALACDFILASDNAKLGLPEVGLGLIPGYGGTQRLTHNLGPNWAKRIIFSAEMFTAQTMKEIGLVVEVVPQAELINRCAAILTTISQKSPDAITFAKRAIWQASEGSQETGYAVEAEMFGAAFDSENRVEGVKAFLEKRKPKFVKRPSH
jgi:enoyl-CoA hydratase